LQEGRVRGETVREYERCFSDHRHASGLCLNCGIPVDSRTFDESRIDVIPDVGGQIVLAAFELPSQYCGALEHVAQFTDLSARRPDQMETPGLEWSLAANGRAVYPFSRLNRILNPWGFGSFRTDLRLDEGARLELIVRRTASRTSRRQGLKVELVGGRIVGRYWYNRGYGEPVGRQ
jgi:hypothetical protein